jgi:plastocyanin
MRRMLVMVTALLLAATGVAGCGDDDGGGDAADSATAGDTGSDQQEGDAGDDTGGGERIALTASDFEWAPADLVMDAGEEATLVVGNNGNAPHNLTIEDLDVDEDLDPGGTAEVSLTPEAGEYEFFCAIHPDQMRGTLTAD